MTCFLKSQVVSLYNDFKKLHFKQEPKLGFIQHYSTQTQEQRGDELCNRTNHIKLHRNEGGLKGKHGQRLCAW